MVPFLTVIRKAKLLRAKEEDLNLLMNSTMRSWSIASSVIIESNGI